MSQYAFSLSLPPVFSADNFYLSDSNRVAHRLVTAWPDWPARTLLLHGPAGSGKSHLASIWAQQAHATLTHAKNGIPGADSIGGNWLLENIEQAKDAAALLHVLNYVRERDQWLLLTSAVPAAQLPLTLPDLTSRLKALPVAAITPPDDEVLAAALRKQFADRQLKVEEEVIAYLLPRIERSFASVQEVVETLDRKALSERKALTVPFVKQTLNY